MIVNGQAVVRRERRNDMELYEIVMKLVGPVQPVGETRADEQRLANMKKAIVKSELRPMVEWDSANNMPFLLAVNSNNRLYCPVKWSKGRL